MQITIHVKRFFYEWARLYAKMKLLPSPDSLNHKETTKRGSVSVQSSSAEVFTVNNILTSARYRYQVTAATLAAPPTSERVYSLSFLLGSKL